LWVGRSAIPRHFVPEVQFVNVFEPAFAEAAGRGKRFDRGRPVSGAQLRGSEPEVHLGPRLDSQAQPIESRRLGRLSEQQLIDGHLNIDVGFNRVFAAQFLETLHVTPRQQRGLRLSLEANRDFRRCFRLLGNVVCQQGNECGVINGHAEDKDGEKRASQFHVASVAAKQMAAT